jgi:hypothetical protein
VNLMRKQLDKKLGSPLDRGKVRYVCSTDALCAFELAAGYIEPHGHSPFWGVSKYVAHNCDWHPSDSKAANSSRDIQLRMKQLEDALTTARSQASNMTAQVGAEHCQARIELLRAELTLVQRQGHDGAFLRRVRHYSVQRLAWGVVAFSRNRETPTIQEVQSYITRVSGIEESTKHCGLVRRAADAKLLQLAKVDTLDYLPEYLKCLQDRGWQVCLFTSTGPQMHEKAAGMVIRAWEERRKQDPHLRPMSIEEARGVVPPMEGTYSSGWLVVPPNKYPLRLVPGTNEANRSQVRLVDACHMRAPGNEGTLYTMFRVDPNRSHEGMVYLMLSNVENTAGWRVVNEAANLFEPPTCNALGALLVPAGQLGEQATPATPVVVGDGDKGILEVFGKWLKRCVYHRKANFLKKFPKSLRQAEAYQRAMRAANDFTFRRSWSMLTKAMQDWAGKLPMVQWAQHYHRAIADSQFNGPETMNNKPLMKARKARNQLATLKEIVHMEESRSRALTIQAHSCHGPLPPRVQARFDKSERLLPLWLRCIVFLMVWAGVQIPLHHGTRPMARQEHQAARDCQAPVWLRSGVQAHSRGTRNNRNHMSVWPRRA